MGPEAATILASRRSQSVSNPANVPPLPHPSGLSRSNTTLSRGNTTRLARSPTASAGVMPLRPKTPQGTAGGIASVGAGGETGTTISGVPTTLRSRPSLRRPKVQGAPQVAQQSAPQPSVQSFQPGQYVNATQGMTSLVLPAAHPPAQGGRCSSLTLIVHLFSTLRSSHKQADVVSFEFLFRRTPYTILRHLYRRLYGRFRPSSDFPGAVTCGLTVLSTATATATGAAATPRMDAICPEPV